MKMSLTGRGIMMSIISLAEPEIHCYNPRTHTYTLILSYGGGIQERDQADTVMKLLFPIYNYSISPLQHWNVLSSLSPNRLPRLLPLHPNHPAIFVPKLPVFPSLPVPGPTAISSTATAYPPYHLETHTHNAHLRRQWYIR